MPNWGNVLNSIQKIEVENPLDTVRKKYLNIMHQYTDRNIIAYYSGFLQRPNTANGIDDNDKNAFMQAVHKLDKTKGLDLILHTPGGDIASTESIVSYLKQIFGNDIRAIIPQMAMSAGTMISLSCKSIVMGKQSSIGPIDPQYGGISCAGVIEEFDKALEDISENQNAVLLWQTIISKYHPTFLGDCQKAIDWAEEMVKKWLLDNMLSEERKKEDIAENIIRKLSSHAETKSHSRHIHIEECEKLGIKILKLETLMPDRIIEDCIDLQDCVLTLHHSYMHTFSNSAAVKIIENNIGNAMIINTRE